MNPPAAQTPATPLQPGPSADGPTRGLHRYVRQFLLLLLAGLLAFAVGTGCKPDEEESSESPAKETEKTDDDGDEPDKEGDEDDDSAKGEDADEDDPTAASGEKPILDPVPAAPAPAAAPRIDAGEKLEELRKAVQVENRFTSGRRLYVQVDKPLYNPGETIWVKSWDLKARTLEPAPATRGIRYELVSPRGDVVQEKKVRVQKGTAHNDFALPADIDGGEYIVRATTFDNVTSERPVIVRSFEPPRVKKKLEFVRKAYGEGDAVSATIEVKRPTGEPLANHPLTAVVRLDGKELPRVELATDAGGTGTVEFKLPDEIETGDGLLTVLVEDGGVTESVSKRIPIVLKRLQFSMFPEGGKLVTGLPSRVYFEAKNSLGKPADIEGELVDNHGNTIGRFSSVRNGLGRFELTPSMGKKYQVKITRPVGISEQFPVPLAEEDGCVMRSYDDFDGQEPALRVGVRCSEPQDVIVVGMLRGNMLDSAKVHAQPDEPAAVYLKPDDAALAAAQGIARVTVFDDKLTPLAERLVFRNRRNQLDVDVESDLPDGATYAPRDKVTLSVKTRDPLGEPVPAELALSVVDDTVVSFADDKTGHMLSKVLLEPEIPGDVEEPNYYFDLREESSAIALDLLMGTRGWRQFGWQRVLDPTPEAEPEVVAEAEQAAPDEADAEEVERAPQPRKAPRPRNEKKAEAPPRVDEPAPVEEDIVGAEEKRAAEKPAAGAKAKPKRRPAKEARAKRRVADGIAGNAQGAPADREIAGLFDADDDIGRGGRRPNRIVWAPVREFPKPDYSQPHEGPRTDFRETVLWAPTVETDENGEASVEFYLSDAVTSFRVFTEGVGGGAVGRDETVISSKLPFSMNIKLPVEVSAGDRLELPLTLSNEMPEATPVALAIELGEHLKLDGKKTRTIELAANARQSITLPVDVVGQRGESKVRIEASAAGVEDEFVRTLKVVPPGFPQQVELAGTVADSIEHKVDLGDALQDSSTATVRLYPGPVSTMVAGLESMLRQPTGCFEQASSSNYPNVMVMQYFEEHDVDDPEITARSRKLLEDGYRRLTGYESPSKGYEWFGGNPGHEALTAYGLMEFQDMKDVHQVDPKMLERTAKWLLSRRDGEGGFKRNQKALDSFGRASKEVTDAYITWALTEAGYASELAPQLEAQKSLAQSTKDPYLLALATNSLLNSDAHRRDGLNATKRLLGMQDDAGHWPGADHSITRSGGKNLQIETTALAVLALLKAEATIDRVRKAVSWLEENRGGFGQWGATQATVLALKAMTAYASANRATQHPGTIILEINGKQVGRQDYVAGRRDPIDFVDLGEHLQPGENDIRIVRESQGGGDGLPYSIALEYRSLKPATSPDAVIAVETSLEKDTIPMGETVRLSATVENTTDGGQPMTLARIGIPGGLTHQEWQLKELRDKGTIDFYETRPREVIVYFRALPPGEKREVPLDLTAVVPGTYTGPASSSYLYYTDEHRHWTDGLKVKVAAQ